MADINFDKLMDTGFWEKVVFVGIGFVAPTLLRNTVEGRIQTDLPDEAYGAAITVMAPMVMDSGQNRTYLMTGAGLHSADALLERFNVKGSIPGMGN